MKCDNPECACNKDTSIKEASSEPEIAAQIVEGAEQALDSLMQIAASGSEMAAVAAGEVLLNCYCELTYPPC